MKYLAALLVLASVVGANAQPGPYVVLRVDAPIVVIPEEGRQPLHVAKKGTTLPIMATSVDGWFRVEFDVGSFGPRIGYIQAKFVDLVHAEAAPATAANPKPVVAAAPPPAVQEPGSPTSKQPKSVETPAPALRPTPPTKSAIRDDGRFMVRIYVDAVPPQRSAEGFIDGDNKWERDSVADMKKQLHKKWFRPNKGWPGSKTYFEVVDDALGSDLTVTVVTRGVSAATFGQRTVMSFYRNVVLADTVPKVGYTRWVSAVIAVGSYRKEMVGWSTIGDRSLSWGAWTEASRQLALVTASWVMANEATVKERQRAGR